jgi:alpha-ribazole phosphatase
VSSIVLIRHPETDLAGKFCGHSDPALNSAGEHRLRTLVKDVEPLGINRIYSSDLRRASRTAIAIGQRIAVPVEFRPSLREINFGAWDGLSWDEIERQYPDQAHAWMQDFSTHSAPGGEPYPDFVARVDAEFALLAQENKDTTYAVVTHRGVMQCALTRWFGFAEADAWAQTAAFGAIIVVCQSKVSSSVRRP